MPIVRRGTPDDRERILEISSQIWDGEDYVPELLENWLADQDGELAVAVLDGNVISFAHRTWLCPGIAWLEGIRTDPAWEGHGAGRAITEHFIRSAREDGASRIELSTHIENQASIHIIESYGFQLVGTFSYVERPRGTSLPPRLEERDLVRAVSAETALQYMDCSDFLERAQRRFPRGWRFFPFDHDPKEAIARLECLLGVWAKNKLTALLCVRQRPDDGNWSTINFLDGDPDAVRILLDEALRLYRGNSLHVMVPVHEGQHSPVLEILKERGFTSWTDFTPDVFAYELVL